MISTKTWFLSWALGVLCAVPSIASGPYDFSILEKKSGFVGKAGFEAQTTGTLIGDYDPINNPTGTRTKPGLLGSFGSTENVAVNVSLNPSLGGDLSTSNSGSFSMVFDKGAGTVSISKYHVDFLSSGPVKFPAGIELINDAFRTRNPDAFYLGGIPINIPFGSAEISSLSAVQTGGGNLGTMAPNGQGGFNFNVALVVEVSGEFMSPFGAVTLPGVPLPLLLQGSVSFLGKGAIVRSQTTINFNPEFSPNLQLPQFPLGLPTLLPPGGTANVLFDLNMDQITGVLNGTQTLVASGQLIPEPQAALCLLLAGWIMHWVRTRIA